MLVLATGIIEGESAQKDSNSECEKFFKYENIYNGRSRGHDS